MKKIVISSVVAACFFLFPTPSQGYFQDYPYLNNETLGLFNYIHAVSQTDPDNFNPDDWGEEIGVGIGMGYYRRYILAFTAYGVSMAAEQTPAYPKPFTEALDGLTQKMLNHHCWQDWVVADWGGADPLYPYNIMYTGHLLLMMALYERQAGDRKYDSEQKLTYQNREFTTNMSSLSGSLYDLILNNQDSLGEKYYAVCCETNRVFVPCNVMPHYALHIVPPDPSRDLEAVTPFWLAWIKENMQDPGNAYFYEMFIPFDPQPYIIKTLNGAYTAWSLSFLDGLDHKFVEAAYPVFKKNAVIEDVFGTDTAFILTSPTGYEPVPLAPPDPSSPQSSEPSCHSRHHTCPFSYAAQTMFQPLMSYRSRVSPQTVGVMANMNAMDVLSTIFGMVLAREMDDQDLFRKLTKGMEVFFGQPAWQEDKWQYGYFDFNFLKVAQNGFPLLARALTPESNFRTIADSHRGPEFYRQPILSDVSNPKTFVNQAIWDPAKHSLFLTINGGEATSQPTDLTIANLNPDSEYKVILGGVDYSGWTRSGSRIVITTPALSASELEFQITDQSAGTSGCGCHSLPDSNASPWLILLGILGFVLVRSRRRGLTRDHR